MKPHMTNTIARREFIRIGALAVGGIFLLSGTSIFAAENSQGAAIKKPLIVYFSRSGHTRQIAEDIKKFTGADMIEIETATPYPEDYDKLVELAKNEQNRKARPAIKNQIPDLKDYGVIFLGYPNWWSSMPMPVYTFIEQAKLNGATIAPFVTHGGGGLGHSIEDLKKLVPDSKILKPFSVGGNSASRAQNDVRQWLEGFGPALVGIIGK